MRIAFFGSSILSSYWNGAATYYRGLLRNLSELGYEITFYEPDAYSRQENRDVESLPWVKSVVYNGEGRAEVEHCLAEAKSADVVVKASGVGVFDELLEQRISNLQSNALRVFWDVDAPATLDRVLSNPADFFLAAIPKYDIIFTYGGGRRVVDTYLRLGARRCVPIYNAADTDTHYPESSRPELQCCVAFQGNRLPDRERRVDEFFFKPAELVVEEPFLLGGSGWDDKPKPGNVHYLGHVGTPLHNAFNSSARFVLNINRESMASYGFSPPTRVFEAAAAGACLITDAWEGIEMFLKPGVEIIVANDGHEVAAIAKSVSAERARNIGRAARTRILSEHTYRHRALQVHQLLQEFRAGVRDAGQVFA